ncbi:MAG: response regulator transcription factor [Anaerotruncus massiliensis (ex Togo et al. 2019)]
MRILLVEDDVKLCEAVAFALNEEGFEVDVCHDGDDGLRWAREGAHDLILLDRMLPVMDGVTVRASSAPAGFPPPSCSSPRWATSAGQGLDAGADDYLVKPFSPEELLARVRAMCRRPRRWESSDVTEYGDVVFDAAKKSLRGSSGGCALSKREAALLETLLKNPGQTLPRAVLLTRVWGPDAGVEDGNLDNYIHFLRRRLRSVGSRILIQTVRGVGYRLEEGDV